MNLDSYQQTVDPSELRAFLNSPGNFEVTKIEGRTAIAEGWVRFTDDPRSSHEKDVQDQLKKSSGMDSKEFHASHVIPYCLGGRGLDNLFIAPQKVNQSYLSALESQIIDFAKTSPEAKVYLKATLEWGTDKFMPEKISYQAFMMADNGSMVVVHSSSQKISWKHPQNLTLKEQLDLSRVDQDTKRWVRSSDWNGVAH